jgi:DNA-binding response OmpR family regulator
MALVLRGEFEKRAWRGPVTIDRIVISGLPRKERAIIIALAASMPRRLTLDELIEFVYPDPDHEPRFARNGIKVTIGHIRKKRDLGGWAIRATRGVRGYWLEKVS